MLGDAAHQIMPVGPDAVSEAILDAAALADCLAGARDAGASVVDGLTAYERRRREASAVALLARRTGGIEQVLDRVEERAPDGFTDVETVMPHAERAAVVAAVKAKWLVASGDTEPHELQTTQAFAGPEGVATIAATDFQHAEATSDAAGGQV